MGPTAWTSGTGTTGSAPHGAAMRARPFTWTRHAISPDGIHAGDDGRVPCGGRSARTPSRETRQSCGPSALAAVAASQAPSALTTGWRRSFRRGRGGIRCGGGG